MNTTAANSRARTATAAQLAERRQKVAGYYLAHLTETEIAFKLGVSQATISRDVQAILAEWKTQYLGDTDLYVVRELADLDEMERQAIHGLETTSEAIWLLRRIQIKTRRAKLLGLDAPSKVDLAVFVREKAAELGLPDAEAAVRFVEQHLREVRA